MPTSAQRTASAGVFAESFRSHNHRTDESSEVPAHQLGLWKKTMVTVIVWGYCNNTIPVGTRNALKGFRHNQTVLMYGTTTGPLGVCLAPEKPGCLCTGGTWEDGARYNNFCPEPLNRTGGQALRILVMGHGKLHLH